MAQSENPVVFILPFPALCAQFSPKTRLYSFSRFPHYAHNLDSLNKKNGMSATPLN